MDITYGQPGGEDNHRIFVAMTSA